MEPGNVLGCNPNSGCVFMYPLLVACCFQSRNCKQHIKSWTKARISVLASCIRLMLSKLIYFQHEARFSEHYASLSVKQFDTHCTPTEKIVMETGGREAFMIAWTFWDLPLIFIKMSKVWSLCMEFYGALESLECAGSHQRNSTSPICICCMVFEIQLFFLLLWGPSSQKHGATTFWNAWIKNCI